MVNLNLHFKWEYNFTNREQATLGYLPTTRLSNHFRFYELVQSKTADCEHILNKPSLSVIQNAELLAHKILDPVRERFGVTIINSWFRCEYLEREIASVGYSKWLRRNKLSRCEETWKAYFSRKQHPTGSAADIEVRDPKISNRDLFNWIKANLEFDQLILENVSNRNDPRSGWVHVSFAPDGKNRNEAFEL